MSAKHVKRKNRPADLVSSPQVADSGSSRLGKTETRADDDNRDELQRLLTALDYADGFAIFFARCNVPVQRRQLIAEIRQQLSARNLYLLELQFERPVRDLRSHLRRLLSQQRASPPLSNQVSSPTLELALAEAAPNYRPVATPVLSISGLEFSIPFDKPNAALLSELNLGRELFRRDAPYPLLIWLPDYAITAVARHAPDFWAWRSSVFTFHSQDLLRTNSVQTLAGDEAGWIAVQNLSPEEKQRRLRLLESLLDDYAGLPDDPRTRRERADLLTSLGQINHVLNRYEQALDYYSRSLKLLQEIGDKQGEGTTLNNISQIYSARGDYDTALSYLERSFKLLQEIGDKQGEGTTLNNISQIYSAHGDYDTALSYLERSLAIRQEIGDKQGEGATLNNISQIYDTRGDYETALSTLERSLKIRQEIGDKQGEGTTLNNISALYHVRGDYETALSYLERSLKISQEIGDKAGEGTTLNNISALYHARGDYDTALSYLERSLKIRQEIGDKQGEGTTLNNISALYHARGDYETALSYLERSLAILQEIGDKQVEGTTLNNISQIYAARGDYETALSYLERSLKIRQEIGDSAGLCATLFNMGLIFRQNEQMDDAMNAWVTVYRLAKLMGLAQVLQALESLAGSLGLSGGLQAWEELSRRAGG
jgi:tetratricopeptide (TPR) repeat protein